MATSILLLIVFAVAVIVGVSEAFYTEMARHPRVTIARISNGTNIARMTIRGAAASHPMIKLEETDHIARK